ncbi:MAG TPA: hypothetical protein VFM68_02935 [Candidatus Saccharimonadales bacterium]|nr:hypothetical protein [Candidatus Saccharimonadales bacterium]
MEHPTSADLSFLDRLESVTTDPMVDKVFATAREYEEMINSTGSVTAEDRIALIAELNDTWPFMGMKLQVSGRLSFADTESGEVKAKYYDDRPMISNGFCFIEDHIMSDEEVVAEHYKVGLHMIRFADETSNEGELGVGLLDDVAIDYPVHSPEMIENRLRYFHSETMERLDTIVLNCETEEQAVMQLKDFTIDAIPSDTESMQVASDLQVYLSSILEFDDRLPYNITIAGDCFAEVDGVVCAAKIEEIMSGVAGVAGVKFLQQAELPSDQEQCLMVCIEIYWFTADKKAPPLHLYLPSKSIQDITSVRRITYEEED